MYFGWRSLLSLGVFAVLLLVGWGWFFRQRFTFFSRRTRTWFFLVLFVIGCGSGTVLLKN